jgi:hypothetical protein
MLEEDRYNYSVVWLAEQHAFAGLCNDFIGMNCLAPTYDEALDGIREMVSKKGIANPMA